MNAAAKVIHKLEKKDYSDFGNDQNVYILLQLLAIKQFYPILILFKDSSDEQKNQILDVLVRYGASVVF